MERRIEADLAACRDLGSATAEVPGAELPGRRPASSTEANISYRERYVDYLISQVGAGLNLRGVRIALDAANGAASHIAPRVFQALGADVEVLSAEPNGHNINEGCGSLHPENLIEAVKARHLDLGVAFDGDADRALLVDDCGRLIDGDYELMILGEHLKSCGRLNNNLVVTTVMSNIGLEIALAARGIEILRTSVGDRYVLEGLLARNASLGGEQSGHIIFTDISLAGDGIVTAMEVLRAIAASGRSLADAAAGLTKYPQVLVNLTVSTKPALDGLPAVKAEMDRINEELDGRGRLLVRYSGTENLARIMVEGEDQIHIEGQANRLAEILRREIG
jgi:phosphoglucosamine mutase